jgi:hypothetical protein
VISGGSGRDDDDGGGGDSVGHGGVLVHGDGLPSAAASTPVASRH